MLEYLVPHIPQTPLHVEKREREGRQTERERERERGRGREEGGREGWRE